MGFMSLLLLFTLFLFGGYAIFMHLRLRRQWLLFDSKLLLPGNCKAADCKDPDAYLDYIYPRLLRIGFGSVLCGLAYIPVFFPAIGLSMGLSELALTIANYVLLAVGLGLFIWFAICQSRAARRFW